MTITYAQQPSAKSLATLNALREAVAKALETKRKLGHYAVFEENGRIIEEHFSAPQVQNKTGS